VPIAWACLTACSLNSAVYSCFGIFFTCLPPRIDIKHRTLEDEKQWAAQPYSANRNAYVICSSENLDLFIASPCAPSGLPESNRTSSFEKSGILERCQYSNIEKREEEIGGLSRFYEWKWHFRFKV
jgi:hypothetical protein